MVDDGASSFSCAGANVDDVVSVRDDPLVVFDDGDGGSLVHEPVEESEESVGVGAVESGGRFVEHEPQSRGFGSVAEVFGEQESLAFASG